ncbi:MAG TPA: Spy/CpxP family protein refolding chaperone [Stellaceae bacterium]|nr:Spy/CpxP family protein refolding chaperone [Stellaceae bacterium]
MSDRKFIIPALVLAAALGSAGAVTLPVQQAVAQTTTGAPPPPHPGHRPWAERPNFIEGRIAFLKAELKITPAQSAQFDKVAQAMRENTAERRKTFQQMRAERDQPPSALQHLEMGARLASMHAQQTDRFLAAFRPLYDSMTPAQKKTADEIMGPHRFHHRGRF